MFLTANFMFLIANFVFLLVIMMRLMQNTTRWRFLHQLFFVQPSFVSVNWCKFASTFMSHYALEPWEGLEVAQASETGYFIKGKGGIKWNTLATLIKQSFFCQGLTYHKSSTNHFITLFNFTFIFNSWTTPALIL